MRSETAMFDLILGFAKADNRVRAVILNGSRANPNATPDVLQDYDIVYLVTDFESFMQDHSWVDIFGKKLVHQLPDADQDAQTRSVEKFAYLMQFTDGNRIDLTIAKTAFYRDYCFADKLSVILLDKDNCLPALPTPNESSHYIQPPCQASFDACCCEFWWVAPYVAKGLWRGQLLFAQQHMESCIREELLHMLSLLVGAQQNFAVSAGKCGDKLQQYLPAMLWQQYLATYAPCTQEALWNALETACALFTQVSHAVAKKLGFTQAHTWDVDVPPFLRYIKALPRNATTMNLE